MKKVKTFVDNRILNDTYLLINDNKAVVIDPSFKVSKLIDYIKENELELVAVLLTHGHYDHFAGLEALGKEFTCPYYISEEDESFLYDKRRSMADKEVNGKPIIYQDSELLLDGFSLQILKVPGHTLGSVVIVWEDKMFTGDFIFHGDTGRVDLPGGSAKQMEISLREFAKIDGDYIIYPGHEESTTLAQEKKTNRDLKNYV